MDLKKIILDAVKNRPVHYVWDLRKNPHVVKAANEVMEKYSVDWKFALYIIANDANPICEYNNLKKLRNFNNGMVFCGNHSVCQCNKESSLKKTKKTSMEKYGVNNFTQTKEYVKKTRKTKLEKYGNENYVNKEKIKQTILERYGVENPFQSEELKLRSKQTKLEKYGDENYNNREKAKNTNLKRHGVEYPSVLPEFKEKIKQTNLERYGVENPMQNLDICEKSKQTNMKNHGGFHNSQLPENKNKVKDTQIKRYGSWWNQQHISEEILLLLEDGEKFKEFIIGKTVFDISSDLNVHGKTIRRYLEIHNCGGLIRTGKSESRYEKMIKDILEKHKIDYVQNTRSVIAPLELDFYLPDHNIAIEVNGTYWHSELAGGKDKYYHFNKWKACKDQGIDLYSYFSDEMENIDLIESKILYLAEKCTNSVGARKCSISPITNSKKYDFLMKHHIQGSIKGTKNLGAFYNGNLIAIMCWQKKEKYLEITRYACDTHASYPGLFSKMMNHMIKELNYSGDIVSFSNNGHSNGNVYRASGFQMDKILPPAYWYTKDYILRENRQKYMKYKIEKMFGINVSKKTAWQIMQDLGYDRIWDSGKIKWVKYIE